VAPTPGPGGTHINVPIPDPTIVNPEKGYDFIETIPSGIWAIVGGLILIYIVHKLFKSLPWQLIGPILLLVLFFVAFGDKFRK